MIKRLLAKRRSGYTLPQQFYSDADVFDFDLQAIFHSHWLQAALEIEIPNTGDYVTQTVGRSPIVILRGANGGVSAFYNTCRHRGAQICQDLRGHLSRFICPYHQWTYDLNGKLLRATSMQQDFDTEAHGLRPIPVETVAGVIYLCLSDNPPDFRPVRAALEPLLEPHELYNAKIAHTAVLTERANWKLVMENARECHHCRARHPEFMRAFRDFDAADYLQRPEPWLREFWARCETKGLKSGPVAGPGFKAARFPLVDGAVSLTIDGKAAVAKTLGRVGDGDVGTMRWSLEPNCFNHALGDYAFFFQLVPTGPQETTVTAKWVVNKDATEGVDYDLARLLEVWDATNNQDKWLVENNQRGVNSASYMPGPYSTKAEVWVIDFVDWYCAAVETFLDTSAAMTGEEDLIQQ